MTRPDNENDKSRGHGALTQRLAAILAADVVGYSRLVADDLRATVLELDETRLILKSEIEAHGGRVVDQAGDSTLAVFDTAGGAVIAALLAQAQICARAEARPDDRKMMFRVGVHLGEIIEKTDGTVYGNGVNIASRLESLAPPGGVTVSREVQALVEPHSTARFVDHGEYEVKNITDPVRVFLVTEKGSLAPMGLSSNVARLAFKGNLPATSSRLIGRTDALAEVSALIASTRLITLLGMGGMGKTRLSIEAARRAAPKFPDGTWFIDLAAVSEASAVPLAVAGVFGVTQQSGKTIEESLVDALGRRRMLLIFDNCEHVTAAAATLVDAILAACPEVQVIATSREELSIAGEHLWPVTPLDVAGDESPAVCLFDERARSVLPGFDLSEHAEDVGEICRELEGIPLAIELAAARVRSLSTQQILERLSERFRLLTGGSRAARERHQTLLQAVQWSYELLSADERAVLTRASVFAGGFTLEAAEHVCVGGGVSAADVLDLLDSLVRKSLLQVDLSGDRARYGMLDTIRAFGIDRLAEAEQYEVRRHHASFYAAESDANFIVWRSPRELEAYQWLDLEINNLRKAFRWSLENNEVDFAARIASNVGDLGRFRLLEEAANWAEEVVDLARAARHRRLIVLVTWCASSAWAFSRFDDAQRFGEEAIALLADDAFDPFVWAYGDLAFVSMFRGDIDHAIELLKTAANHPADRLDRFMLVFLLYIMATTGHLEEALAIADDVVAKAEAAGVPMSIAVAYGGKGAAYEATDADVALASYERGIEVAGQCGARFMETLIAPRIAALHARSGEPEVALEGFRKMLIAFGEATDIASVSVWRASLVVLFAKLGYFHAAATLHGSLAGLIDASGVVPEHPAAVERVRSALGEDAFEAAARNGAAMSLREASHYAFVQVELGLGSLGQAVA